MLWLKTHIERIESLLAAGDPESLTFAALRARLALEEVCYERLKLAHDYISPEDLKRWQPRDVVNTLIREVDPNVASDLIFSISTQPTGRDAAPQNAADYESMEFIEVGRQKGFDAVALGKIWNSLGSFLHVSVPQSKADSLSTFGNSKKIERNVRKALELLSGLSTATLIAGGIGEVVTFECNCGTLNKRRAQLLAHGQVINCFSSTCKETWIVEVESKGINFTLSTIPLKCSLCTGETPIPRRMLLELEREQMLRFDCSECGRGNIVIWKLVQAAPPIDAQLGAV